MNDAVLNEETLISRRETIVAADVADDAILLDIDSGYFFQLNKSAARIWNLLETPKTFASLCADLQQAFQAGDSSISADAREFVFDLQQRGIIDLA
jgi:hypothetical protein